MTDWASNTNYALLPGLQEYLNGTPTKALPADYPNGFKKGAPLRIRELNYLIDELKDATATALTGVPITRSVLAGNGLTGGGTLAANRTYTVQPDGGSIAVSGSGIAVGALATDAQHGTRGGGTQHSAATTSVAGFISATDMGRHDTLWSDYNNRAYSQINVTSTGTQNDFAPTGWDAADLVVCTVASNLTITGLAAPSATGKRVKRFFLLPSAGDVIISDDSASSAAANRIWCSTNFRRLHDDYAGWLLVYATGASTPRWHVVGNVRAEP